MEFDIYKQETIELIAKRIKALRSYKGYTNNEQFASTYNIARAQYGRYERGTDMMMLSSLLRMLYAHNHRGSLISTTNNNQLYVKEKLILRT